MQRAIAEARLGATRVSPNPLVGCVVLDAEGNFLSQGHHEFFGGPHAEVNALKNLNSEQLKGAHVFVTLEPCAHQGKTPSCAKMLAQLPIKKVTYGLVDPNPLVRGQGAAILNQAGIETEVFPHLQTELEEVCEAFLWNFRQKKVFVTLKLASSLDGIVALENGESRWITNEQSRRHSHYLRACYDGILVGSHTVELDNPSLNIRHPEIQKENKVIVLDTEGALLSRYFSLKISQVHKPENVFWCVAEDVNVKDLNGGPQVIRAKRGLRNLNLHSVLESLWIQGFRSVFVEGGARIASSFLELGLVNRLYLFQAPVILGHKGGRSWTSSLKVDTMNSRYGLINPKYTIFEDNIMTTGLLSGQPRRD